MSVVTGPAGSREPMKLHERWNGHLVFLTIAATLAAGIITGLAAIFVDSSKIPNWTAKVLLILAGIMVIATLISSVFATAMLSNHLGSDGSWPKGGGTKIITYPAGFAFLGLVFSGIFLFAFFVCVVLSAKEPITESHTPASIVTQASKETRLLPIFGRRYLGAVTNFRIGGASINADGFKPDELTGATDALKGICDRWRELGTPDALVLIVGATDRLPLGGPTRKQYDANTGLALARAAAVREYLGKSCWQTDARKPDSENVILLISGPQSTPQIFAQQKSEVSDGFPSDRRVDVWIFSAVPYSDADAIKE